MKTPKTFLGAWRITETEVWDKDALDLVVPAHLTFTADGLGHFQMIAVQGDIDARFEGNRVEFSWVGDDDGSETNGRGWGEIRGGRQAARAHLPPAWGRLVVRGEEEGVESPPATC